MSIYSYIHKLNYRSNSMKEFKSKHKGHVHRYATIQHMYTDMLQHSTCTQICHNTAHVHRYATIQHMYTDMPQHSTCTQICHNTALDPALTKQKNEFEVLMALTVKSWGT